MTDFTDEAAVLLLDNLAADDDLDVVDVVAVVQAMRFTARGDVHQTARIIATVQPETVLPTLLVLATLAVSRLVPVEDFAQEMRGRLRAHRP